MGYTTLDFEVNKFKKFGGEVIDDITQYIKEYTRSNKDIKIIVGCDSAQRRSYTHYALTIVLYNEVLHKGAHVLFMRMKNQKERDLFTRMMNEAMYSLDLAEWLETKLDTYYYSHNKNDYDNTQPIKKVEIHVDINSEYGENKHNKSHIAYPAVMGMISGSGYSVKGKPNAYAASCAADLLVK